MVVGLVGAPDVVEVLELIGHRHLDPVEHRHLVRRADEGTFRTRSVVAVDVDDERVVEPAHVFDGLDHAADLVVGVGDVRGEDVDLAGEHLLLVGRELIPLLQQVLRPRRELGVLRDDAELLLVLEDPLAELVPALVEQVHIADLLDPLRRRVMRRMRAARHVVDEERLVGRQRVDLVHVPDRLVGHRGDEIVVGIALERVDVRRVAGEVVRLPLVRVAAHEAVEVLEAHADRPLVERADRAGLERRRVVVLAEPGGAVAVVPQYLADRGFVLGDEAVVPRVAGRLFGDDAVADRVVVAAGDQRGARRRAQRGRVKVGVAEAVGGDAVERRRRNDAAEGAGDAVAGIVGHDQQNVGCALRWDDACRPVGGRPLRRALDLATELLRRRGDLVSLDRGGGGG